MTPLFYDNRSRWTLRLDGGFFRATALADRRLWHIVGLTTHLFLGAANLLFWSSFIAQDLIVVGVVTTALHTIFAAAQGTCAKRKL
jgi:hypothetical protein